MSCILMNEVLKEIEAESTPSYDLVSYDYDNDVTEVAKYDPGTILPVYIIEDENGAEVARSVGEKSKKALVKFLTENGVMSEN